MTAAETCAACWHPVWDHHGDDHGVSQDQGCITGGMLVGGVWDDSWCHCPLTCTEARRGAHIVDVKLGPGCVRCAAILGDGECEYAAEPTARRAVRPQDATGGVQALPVSQRCNSSVLGAQNGE